MVAFSCLFALLLYVQQDSNDTAAQCYKNRTSWAAGFTEQTRGERKMLLKVCRCGQLIPQSIKMCERCAAQEQSRHTVYNNTRRDAKAAAFYISREWRTMRPIIISVFDSIDIYALYVFKELVTLTPSDPVHHIIELEDDWSQRLNPFNLLPVSQPTHNTITAMYKKDKATMRATQTQIRGIIEHHFKEVGGIEKVLCDAGLVAPPQRFGENSPREIR